MTAQAQTVQDGSAEMIEEIIRLSKLSYERLPMLEVVFERYLLALAPDLKTYTSVAADVMLEEFEYTSCAEALQSISAPSFLAVTEARNWDGTILVGIDPPLLFSTLEIMLGGRSTKAPNEAWSPRGFTAIEKRIGKRFCEVALSSLSGAFGQVAEVDFAIDHLETSTQSTVLAPPTTPCVKVVLKIAMESRVGRLTFLLPYNSFEKVRPVLAQAFLGGKLGGDSSWREQLTQKLHETDVTLAASLHEFRLPLSDVLSWAPGQTLDLGIGSDSEVTVKCNGLAMFRGAMGRRKNGAIALRITEDLGGKDAIANDVTAD
jgi:flagellar motor switch protein FliM